MTEILSSLLGMMGIELAPWMAPVAALLIMGLLMPLLWANMKTSRARKLLKQAHLFGGSKGKELEQQALDLVNDRPMGLVAIADEAIRRGRLGLAREAAERLRETGKERAHLRRLRDALDPTPLPHSIDEVILLIERLEKSGMREEAKRRWQAARRRWPRAEVLLSPPWLGAEPSASAPDNT